MRRRSTLPGAGVLILFAFATPPVLAAESFDNCVGFIDALPAVVSTQGTWCLRHDVATAIASGNAITIAANNVTLDCNDFKLGGLAAGAGTQTVGVRATERVNLIVRNCNIRGFKSGLAFTGVGSGGHLVEDNRFEANTQQGMQVFGNGSIVRRNLVSDTGGSTNVEAAEGIVVGNSVDVMDNTVSSVTSTGSGRAVGIKVFANPDGSISGNRVRDLVYSAAGGGASRGIAIDSSGHLMVRNNDLTAYGGSSKIGIDCVDPEGLPVDSATTKDNLVNGFGIAFSGCSDDSANVVNL